MFGSSYKHFPTATLKTNGPTAWSSDARNAMRSCSERTHSSSHEAVSTALHRDEVFKKKKRGRVCITVSRMFCSPESEVCNVDFFGFCNLSLFYHFFFFCRTPVHYLPFRECPLHSPLATRRVIGGHLGVVFPHSGFSAPVATFVSQRYSVTLRPRP